MLVVVVVVVLLLHDEYMILLRLIGLIRLSDHRGALALFVRSSSSRCFLCAGADSHVVRTNAWFR